MRKYLTILRIGWLDAIEYRTEFIISIFGWGIRLFIAIYLWLSVVEARGGFVGEYTLSSIMTYFFIVQIISSFIFVRVGFNIAYDIYRGDFANYLMRPLNYLVFRFVHEMSRNLFRTIISLVLLGGLLIAFLDIPAFPAWKIGLSLLMLPIGYTINFALVCCIALLAFWVTNSTRFMFIYFGILTTFSGMLFPLDLFPPHLYELLSKLPFAYIFYFPAKILWSPAYEPIFFEALQIGLLYTAALLSILAFVYRHGVRRFEAVGR